MEAKPLCPCWGGSGSWKVGVHASTARRGGTHTFMAPPPPHVPRRGGGRSSLGWGGPATAKGPGRLPGSGYARTRHCKASPGSRESKPPTVSPKETLVHRTPARNRYAPCEATLASNFQEVGGASSSTLTRLCPGRGPERCRGGIVGRDLVGGGRRGGSGGSRQGATWGRATSFSHLPMVRPRPGVTASAVTCGPGRLARGAPLTRRSRPRRRRGTGPDVPRHCASRSPPRRVTRWAIARGGGINFARTGLDQGAATGLATPQ